MNAPLLISCLLAGLVAIETVGPAHATSSQAYQKDEYVTISDGLSPDKTYAIATHGDGELGDEDFHVYLMREPGHKKIGPLTEIEQFLDTAASAYTARWSPDGRHVAIIYRSDRRVIALHIYRIENGRAYIVAGKMPLTAAAGWTSDLPTYGDEESEPRQRMRGLSLTWTGPTHFRLAENGRIWVAPDSAKALTKFGRVNTDSSETNAPESLNEVEYKVDADCEIAGGDTYKVLDTRRGE